MEKEVHYGTNLFGALKLESPHISWQKTSQDCSQQGMDKIWELWSGRWQTGGIVVNGEYWTANTLEFPREEKEYFLSQPILKDILEKEVTDRYFLSKKACCGILERTQRKNQEIDPSLKNILNMQIQKSEK